MNFKIGGNDISENLKKKIQTLTNYAIIRLDRVIVDREHGTVEIEMERMQTSQTKGLERLFSHVNYDRKNRIKSHLRIRNIIDISILDRSVNEENQCTVLFGLTIKDNELYISSAEETGGDPMYELSINVNEIDIELQDEE